MKRKEIMNKNFNEFFDELNDMANFKNFGEKVETEDYAELERENEEFKAQIETYKKMFDNEEFMVALTDVRTGERELWQKYKLRMIKAKQCLDEIEKYCKNIKVDHY